MDLGIEGRRARVGAAGRGLGHAGAPAREDVDVTIVARGAGALAVTAADPRKVGAYPRTF